MYKLGYDEGYSYYYDNEKWCEHCGCYDYDCDCDCEYCCNCDSYCCDCDAETEITT